jgi:hypothetical protein
MDRIDMELLVLAQHEHQSPARLFHCDRDRARAESLAQLTDPRFDRLRRMLHLATLALLRACRFETPDMLLIRPIHPHESGELGFAGHTCIGHFFS